MKTIIKYYLFGLTICFCNFTLFAQNRNIDSLFILLKNDKTDTNKVNHLNTLCYEYSKIHVLDTALYYGNTALVLALTLNFKKGIANAYMRKGDAYLYQTNYNKALENWLPALKIEEELENKKGMESLLCNIGFIYDTQSNYPKALDYFLKALKVSEETGNKNTIAIILGNIGGIYKSQKDYSKAHEYFFNAFKTAKILGDKRIVAFAISNIGDIYDVKKKYPEAKDYYLKALKMTEEYGDKNKIASCLLALGNVNTKEEDYPKALDYYFKALKLAKAGGDKNIIASTTSLIGLLYIKTGKFKEAEKYLKNAIALEDSIGTLNELRLTEEYLSQLYDTTGRHKDALIHYKKATSIKDTLFSQEKNKDITRKEMNFEFDKKEAVTKAITEEKSQRQKIITWSIAFGLFLVAVFAGFVFRSLRVTRKQKKIIEVKSKETEDQKKIIEEKQKEILDSINYAKRIQLAMLPHLEEIWVAFPESFILFKPKDIVSGDFYFFHKNNQSVFIAVADCTGHGVPGAFMSMVGAGKLNDSVSQTTETSAILSLLNKGIKTALKQTDGEKSTRDGMDIALCSVDIENRLVKYAGANRPLWIIRKGQTDVEEIKATKTAIGGLTADTQHFDTHELKLQQGDTFYICTDGYADQFGGQTGKKLMTKKFKEILLEIQSKPMKEQEQYLDNFIEKWKAGTEQVDDILVIGIRL